MRIFHRNTAENDYDYWLRLITSWMSSALTVLRPAWVASVVASLLTRTAYSSRIRRISSTASSPTRSAPAFSISLRTAAVESSPFRIKITRKEFEIADSIKVCHFSAREGKKCVLRGIGAAFEPFSSTLSCQSGPRPALKRSGNVRPYPCLRSIPPIHWCPL